MRDATYGMGAIRPAIGDERQTPLQLDVYSPIGCADRRKPVLLFHGQDDQNVNTPPSASEFVAARCKQVGVPAELHLLPGFGHGAWAATVDGKSLVEVTWEFLQRQFAVPQ